MYHEPTQSPIDPPYKIACQLKKSNALQKEKEVDVVVEDRNPIERLAEESEGTQDGDVPCTSNDVQISSLLEQCTDDDIEHNNTDNLTLTDDIDTGVESLTLS